MSRPFVERIERTTVIRPQRAEARRETSLCWQHEAPIPQSFRRHLGPDRVDHGAFAANLLLVAVQAFLHLRRQIDRFAWIACVAHHRAALRSYRATIRKIDVYDDWQRMPGAASTGTPAYERHTAPSRRNGNTAPASSPRTPTAPAKDQDTVVVCPCTTVAGATFTSTVGNGCGSAVASAPSRPSNT